MRITEVIGILDTVAAGPSIQVAFCSGQRRALLAATDRLSVCSSLLDCAWGWRWRRLPTSIMGALHCGESWCWPRRSTILRAWSVAHWRSYIRQQPGLDLSQRHRQCGFCRTYLLSIKSWVVRDQLVQLPLPSHHASNLRPKRFSSKQCFVSAPWTRHCGLEPA